MKSSKKKTKAKIKTKTTTKARAPKAGKKAAAMKPAPRADFGAPIDAFFGKQPPATRPILEALRELVEAAAPDADSSLKWGMPAYAINGVMMCTLAGHKAHVNLVLAGPEGTFADPEGRLSGEGKNGRHLTLTSLEQLPRTAVRGWLRAAAVAARKKR